MSKRTAEPQKGAAFFFEGHEYEYEGSESPGTLTFRRANGSGGSKRVTVAAEEVQRSTGAHLAPLAQEEHGEWLRRLPPVPPMPEKATAEQSRARKAGLDRRKAFQQRAADFSRAAEAPLRGAAARQFYHLTAVDDLTGERKACRLMEPPVERTFVPVPKQGKGGAPVGPMQPGALGITQSPPNGGKEG